MQEMASVKTDSKKEQINRIWTGFIAATIFLFFAFYYWALSEKLPFNSGPDEVAHHHAAGYMYKNMRLAIGPDQEADYFLFFYKTFGTARSYNPPSPYIASAIVATALDAVDSWLEVKQKFRKSNVLIGALAVMLTFLTVLQYTGRRSWAIFGAIMLGFLPQFSFLASYLNSDASAVLASVFLTYAVVRLYKGGVTNSSIVLFGLACGYLLIVKINAWFYCLPLFIYALALFLHQKEIRYRRITGIVLISATLSGGWWVLFNMYHHGIADPLNMGIEKRLAINHPDIPPGTTTSFSDRDIGFVDLITNHEGFIFASYKSKIGNLDWLRLEVGEYIYTAYAIVIIISLLYVIGRLVTVRQGFRGTSGWRETGFEAALLTGVLFLVLIYFYFNLYVDAQSQGKYLVPAFIAIVLLFVSSCLMIERLILSRHSHVSLVIVSVLCSAFIYLHFHAIYRVVIPFYHPDMIYMEGGDGYQSIDIDKNRIIGTNDIDEFRSNDNVLSFKTSGHDPWIMLEIDKDKTLRGDLLVRIRLSASNPSSLNSPLKIYWDDGYGLSEKRTARTLFVDGENTLYTWIKSSSLKRLRIDTGEMSDVAIVIDDIAIAPLAYRQRMLAKLFNMI